MRIIASHVLTMASAALLSGVVVGQEPTHGAASHSVPHSELQAGDIRASNLLGAMVKRLTGDSIGEVEDLIVSADADVRLAVISVGGVLGLGEKTIAIPFDQFMVAPDGSALYLTMSEEELRARPAFDLDADGNLRPADEPAAAAPQTTPEHNNAAAVSQATPEHNNVVSAPEATPQHNSVVSAPEATLDHNNVVAAPLATEATPEDSSIARQSVVHEGERAEKASKQAASTLLGAEVVDSQNSPVGKIDDLIVSAEPLEVQVLVSLNESLGSRVVAVPLPELTIRSAEGEDAHRAVESVETSLTVAQLDALPQFQRY
jgi:sporulation protein YlmC with PRC-barrel domain